MPEDARSNILDLNRPAAFKVTAPPRKDIITQYLCDCLDSTTPAVLEHFNFGIQESYYGSLDLLTYPSLTIFDVKWRDRGVFWVGMPPYTPSAVIVISHDMRYLT